MTIDTLNAITPDRVLSGHDHETTAYVVDDYPYGFRLRCKIRYWIETHPKRGDRFCSQTTNPKVAGEVWNKPKKSTYTDVAAMYLDADDHVRWIGVRVWSTVAEFDRFIELTDGKLSEHQAKVVTALRAMRVAYDRKKAERDAAAAAAS